MEADECYGGDDGLWEEIQLAERFLLSAMYSRAASTASQVLNQLLLKSPDTQRLLNSVDEAPGLKSVVESAGMVLVQATGEMGRLGSLFSVLEEHFGRIEFVPHYLFLPAICLQVSNQLQYSAELALQPYLDGWSPPETSEYFTKTVEGCTVFLPKTVHEDLSEIFSVHILNRKDPQAAISWIQTADLPQTRRQEILDKIQAKATEADQQSSRKTSTQSKPQNRLEEAEAPAKTTKLVKLSPDWLKVFVNILRVFWMQIQNRASTIHSANNVAKTVGCGTFTLLVIYALLKERQLIRRIVSRGFERARRNLVEFYELAFGLQINPLATAQALPNARH